MSIFSHFQQRFASTQQEELTLQEYLELCKQDRSTYASAAERLLLAIGEPELVETANNSRLSRMWKTLSEDMVWLGILAMGHDERRYAIVTKEHERIVESVRRRLRRASREAMVAHLDVTEQRLMARVVDMQMDGAGRSS